MGVRPGLDICTYSCNMYYLKKFKSGFFILEREHGVLHKFPPLIKTFQFLDTWMTGYCVWFCISTKFISKHKFIFSNAFMFYFHCKKKMMMFIPCAFRKMCRIQNVCQSFWDHGWPSQGDIQILIAFRVAYEFISA